MKASMYRKREVDIWRDFLPKLQSLNSYKETIELLDGSPPRNWPGWCFYNNLGLFMNTYGVPEESNPIERACYLRLLRLFNEEGVVKSEMFEDLESALVCSIDPSP